MSEKVLVGIAKDNGQVRSEEYEVIVLDEEGWEEMKEKAGWTLAEQLTGVVMEEILPPEVLETITPEPGVQPEELQIATGGVVVNVPIEPVRWFDDRLCCKHVSARERPPECHNLVDGICRLSPATFPCAFDDPNFDNERVAKMRAMFQEHGLEGANDALRNEEASGARPEAPTWGRVSWFGSPGTLSQP